MQEIPQKLNQWRVKLRRLDRDSAEAMKNDIILTSAILKIATPELRTHIQRGAANFRDIVSGERFDHVFEETPTSTSTAPV